MPIVPYVADLAPALAAGYNTLVAGLPYCYPVSVTDFAAAVAAGADHARLRANAVLVAVEDDAPRGLVHVAVERSEQPADPARGMICSLWYDRGQRAAGQALLEAGEAHLRAQGVGPVLAFHQDYRYPFYHLGHAYLSDRLDHIHALLGMNSYQRCAGEVYLEWPNFAPPTPAACPLEVEVTLEWRPGKGTLPGLVVLARLDGAQVGECVNVSCGEYASAPLAQEAFLTKWLGVDDEWQGRGLGRYLLQRAQWEMRQAGYRQAVISTSWTNHRASLFDGNRGYRAVDWTYAQSRELA